MESCLSLRDIISIALNHGMKEIALTDINGLYGMLFFQELCIKNGIKPILGSHLRYRGDEIYAIIKNDHGYKNLCNIISKIHKDQACCLADIVSEGCEGLVLFSYGLNNKPKDLHIYPLIYPSNNWYYHLMRAKENKAPVFLGGDICYYDEGDRKILRLLGAIQNNTRIDQVSIKDHMISFRKYQEFYEKIEEFSDFSSVLLDIDFLYKQDMIFISSERSADKLKNLVYANVHKRYNDPGSRVWTRIEKELDLIIKKGFCDYFLTVHDIIKDRQFYCGRGSAAASIISYLLFITDIDPILHNLYFERFLNEAREDPPDIDIDFPWDERDDILDYLFNKYSCDNCALVSNIITFKDRMAMREVAKVYGIPPDAISEKTKKITYLTKDQEIEADLGENRWQYIRKLAKRIIGFPRHISVHCGGIIITPPRIYDYVPVEMAKKGMPVIQWEKDQAEMGGLVKIDILGNRTLAVIRDAMKNIKEVKGRDFDYRTLDIIGDEKIKKAFAEGDSIGVFYLESPAIRMLQKKIGSGDFQDIVIHSSIIRPAANKYINEYIKRKKGENYDSLHPVLKEILSETHEIMVYQEDIERVVIKLLGFSIKESVQLRKSLGSKNPDKKEFYKKLFYNKGRMHNIRTELLDKLWFMIDSFSGYSFNKPHSASYVMVSFKSGYFKEYYPAYFYAAVIENRGGYYRSDTYINHARRNGINIMRPGINRAIYTRAIDDDNISLGWNFIKGLSRDAIDNIRKETKLSKFHSFKDFYLRMNQRIDHSQILIMIFSGIFEEFTDIQKVLDLLIEYLNMKGRELYDDHIKHILSQKKIYYLEHKYFGFSLREHPVSFIRKRLKDKYSCSHEIPSFNGKRIVLLGYYTTLKLVSTKKYEKMAFISFEDEKGIYDAVLFPGSYSAFKDNLFLGNLFLIKGKVKKDYNTYHIDIEDLSPII